MLSRIDHVLVAVQDDFIERQTRAQPVAALAELIWNSLDGEASQVNVEFERNDLAGGLSKIVVYDDGQGFPRVEAGKLFGNLGGSWKRLTRLTKTKSRIVHGQEGRGRYKARCRENASGHQSGRRRRRVRPSRLLRYPAGLIESLMDAKAAGDPFRRPEQLAPLEHTARSLVARSVEPTLRRDSSYDR